jgi:hypothetical protein
MDVFQGFHHAAEFRPIPRMPRHPSLDRIEGERHPSAFVIHV